MNTFAILQKHLPKCSISRQLSKEYIKLATDNLNKSGLLKTQYLEQRISVLVLL